MSEPNFYLNTHESFASSASSLSYAEKEQQEETSHSPKELPGKDNPDKSKVADYRVRCHKNKLSMDDISTLCQSFVVRKEIWRPKWFNFTRSDTTNRMLFARIDCTDKFLDEEFNQMSFASEFLPKKGVPVSNEVLDDKFYWENMLTVKTGKFEKWKEIVEEKGDSLKRLRFVVPQKRQSAPSTPPPGFVRSGSQSPSFWNKPPPGFVKGQSGQSPDVNKNFQCFSPPGFVKSPSSKGIPNRSNPKLSLDSKSISGMRTRKVDLLTTMTQMIQMFYPMEGLESKLPHGLPPIVRTKEHYATIKESSPLFFMDAEMCLTDINLMEVTRVTLLDEAGKTIIDTFVKPENKIVDYLTFYSGVTEDALKDVEIHLTDVQEAFRRILPPDAVLCGHSIEVDLRALRLSHPFCIDTSYVYNLTKFTKRTSLRGLAFFFLNKRIQCTGLGHCSYQDSKSVCDLVQLKLNESRSFGIAQFGFDYAVWARKNGLQKCAEFYETALIKDIAKEEYKNLELPLPRKVGECRRCKESLMTQCYIESCMCSKNYPSYCCLCVGLDVKFPKPIGADEFIFGKEIKILQALGDQKTALGDCLKNYKEGRVLIARYLDSDECMYSLSEKRMPVYDMNSHDNVDLFKKFVLNFNVYSCNLCLLEYNGKWVGPEEIDSYIRAVHDESTNYSVISVLFCTETKVVFYANTKLPASFRTIK